MHEYAYCVYISSLSVGEMREHPIVGLDGGGHFLFLKPCSFGEQPDINGRHTTTKKKTRRGWSVPAEHKGRRVKVLLNLAECPPEYIKKFALKPFLYMRRKSIKISKRIFLIS